MHYEMIAKSGNLPIIAYNVPSRTGVNILPSTMLKIASIKNIVGIKEASGNISQILELFSLVGNKVAIYSGDDALNYIFLSLGGYGCISVLSNIMPQECVKLYDIYKDDGSQKANEYWLKFLPLINALFLEVNPVPIKYAMSYLGLCKNELRPPLFKMKDELAERLKEEINSIWCEV